MQKKQKYFLIGVVAVLLCMSLLIGVIANVNGWSDKLKDFFMESTDTQSSGSSLVDKKPVLVNPNDTSTDSDTSGGFVSYKEVLNQDSEEIFIESFPYHTITYSGVSYNICTNALIPNTKYLVEWDLDASVLTSDGLFVMFDEYYSKHCIYLETEFEGSVGEALILDSYDSVTEYLKGSYTFTSGLEGERFALTLVFSDACDEAQRKEYVDLIEDYLFLRISKVE